jgi:hypothetical protein
MTPADLHRRRRARERKFHPRLSLQLRPCQRGSEAPRDMWDWKAEIEVVMGPPLRRPADEAAERRPTP